MPAPAATLPRPTPQKREWTREVVRRQVSITWEHIEQGERGNPYADAVALAVMDALGNSLAPDALTDGKPVCGNPSFIGARFRKNNYGGYGGSGDDLAQKIGNEKDLTTLRWAKVPHLLSVWMERYDRGEEVEPITTELEFN